MADAEKIAARLLEKYPDPRLALLYADPLQRLIAVILSAQCTDARVNQVTVHWQKQQLQGTPLFVK